MSIYTQTHAYWHILTAYPHMHLHTHRAQIFAVSVGRQRWDKEQYFVQRRDSEPGGAMRNHR